MARRYASKYTINICNIFHINSIIYLQLTVAAIKDYNRGRSYLIDLAKRQGVPVFINDIQAALECTVAKVQTYNNRERC